MPVALDTETSGIDAHHGALPFLVTTCDDLGSNITWEWFVDPLTRLPIIEREEDLDDIQAILDSADLLILQNAKFDAMALEKLFRKFGRKIRWPWEKVRCTLMAGHLLATAWQHDLTSMVLHYVGEDIEPYEKSMKVECNAARRMARSKYPTWRIAEKGLPEMPSVKGGSTKAKKGVESESPWKNDSWLPRALARELKLPPDHNWWTVTRAYADVDSASTMLLWQEMEKELVRRNLC